MGSKIGGIFQSLSQGNNPFAPEPTPIPDGTKGVDEQGRDFFYQGGAKYIGFGKPNATPQPIQQQTMPSPSQQGFDPVEVERKMRAGFRAYSGGKQLPIEQYIPQFVEAARNYPVFQQNPYLLPQISILETSGGRNITRENNPLNWGARLQAAGNYAPKSWNESIQDAITAIANDTNARPAGTDRGRTASYYEPFRQTGDLKTLADIYEPANPSYYDNLSKGIKLFEQQ